MRQRQWRPQMTDSERRRGWVFFALYILIFPRLVGWFQRLVSGDAEPLVAESNLMYYTLLFALTALVFWTFLRHAFNLLLDWLPENLFAIVTGFAAAVALGWAVRLIPLPVQDPALTDWPGEFMAAPTATVAVLVILMPLVEEVLFRGLVFGSVRRYSRPLAYAVTVVGYAVTCVWQYIAQPTGVNGWYLLLFIQYLPMSLGLTWCYDNGGSIWAPIFLHAALNATQLAILVR